MAKSLPTLAMVASGQRCFIEVPSTLAAALSAYLRKYGISSDPPEPSSSGVESIVLHRGADAKAVQSLVDRWTQHLRKANLMQTTKTLRQREKELQVLLATSEGKAELEALAARYYASGGRSRTPRTSIVTYILVHERERGLIEG